MELRTVTFSISKIRYQQQSQQVSNSIKSGAGNIVSYGARDSTTGLRSMLEADGGKAIGRYLSNSAPGGVMPIAQSSTIGLAGYISQKPF